MRELKRSLLAGIGCAALASMGCGSENDSAPVASAPPSDRGDIAPLEVDIESRSGSSLRGTARLEPRPDGVLVRIEVDGVPPGTYAAHVHESGDCSAPDASSAGEHFNPDGQPHGVPPGAPRHLGDLGNVEVGQEGGQLEILAPAATLAQGDRTSFLERAIIVHEKADSGAQPSGDAGGRIGCGEIRRDPSSLAADAALTYRRR
jgi:superoxide dismutase, Cu-Zn family